MGLVVSKHSQKISVDGAVNSDYDNFALQGSIHCPPYWTHHNIGVILPVFIRIYILGDLQEIRRTKTSAIYFSEVDMNY